MSQPFAVTFDRNDGPEIPLAQFALLFVGTHWTWSLNNRCKHLSMFMDTRKRTVRVFDRDNRALTFEELAHQIQLPQRPGEEDWHHRDIAEKEKNDMRKLNAAGACEFINSWALLAGSAHANSRAKGFWSLIEELRKHPRAAEIEVLWKLSRIALFHSEASEALEGIRKDLPDDHLPNRSMEVAELADIVIRILDYAGAYKLPLAEVVLEKMAYNTGRPFMHGDKRA